jgi:hypothetical protein
MDGGEQLGRLLSLISGATGGGGGGGEKEEEVVVVVVVVVPPITPILHYVYS